MYGKEGKKGKRKLKSEERHLLNVKESKRKWGLDCVSN